MSEYIIIKRQHNDAKILPVVLVHGLSGNAHRMVDRSLAHIDRYLKINTLLIFPTYVPPYQFLYDNLDGELLAEVQRFTRDRSAYHQKLCLYGFSAGAQFVHRFTYAHPDRVACCAALSAGSWTHPNGTFSDHPGRPGFLDRKPCNIPEVHRVAHRKARNGINKVRWITGCGRKDIRYDTTRAFHANLKEAAPNTRFISFNAGHRATDHIYKSVFQEFQRFA